MTQIETQEREQVATLNDLALVTVMREFSLTLPTAAPWRATSRTTGLLSGLEHLGTLTVLATDGVLGLFLTPTGRVEVLHKDYFTGDVRPAHSLSKATSSNEVKTKRDRKPSKIDQRAALLATL